MNNKKNSLVIVFFIVIAILTYFIFMKKEVVAPVNSAETIQKEEGNQVSDSSNTVKGMYTYTNHGFSIELPKGFEPSLSGDAGGPADTINLPNGRITYYPNASLREYELTKSFKNLYFFVKDEKIGENTFKHYQTTNSKENIYWFKNKNIGYEYSGSNKSVLETFKFIGFSDKNEMTAVKVYFGLASDSDCKLSYTPLYRSVPKTTEIARAAINELLKGPNTVELRERYFTGVNPANSIKSISINNGVASIDFSLPATSAFNAPGRGSCGAVIAVEQIEKTLKQFPSVKNVIVTVNGQPAENTIDP